MQVLLFPVPTKWQPVPSAPPIAVQVARSVELPSPQVDAARRRLHLSVRITHIKGLKKLADGTGCEY
jgi:hypothetical protein